MNAMKYAETKLGATPLVNKKQTFVRGGGGGKIN